MSFVMSLEYGRGKWLWCAAFAAVVLAAGCGDSGTSGPGGAGGTGGHGAHGGGGQGGATGGGGQGGATGGGGAQGAMPGTIEVTVSDVADSEGLALLGVTKTAALAAAFCEPVGATPFAHTELFHPHNDMDPCTEEPDAQVFPPGDYNLAVGTIMGGSKTYERCVALAVTVDGDQQVTAPPFAEWKSPPFDAMDVCNLQ